MNKKDLKAIAAKALKKFDVDEVFVTSDGQVFLSLNYAALNVKDKKLKASPLKFDRTILAKNIKVDSGDNSDKTSYTVKELEAIAIETKDVKQLESLLEAEKSGKSRVTAIEALEARIDELKTNA